MRYSILTLLLLTAYAAVLVACFQQPESIWAVVAFIAWLVGIAFVVVSAAIGNERTKPASRIMLGLMLIYFGMALVGPSSALPQKRVSDYWLFSVFHTKQQAGRKALSPNADPAMFYMSMNEYAEHRTTTIEPLATMNFAFLYGLIGGSMALWRYRRKENAIANQ